MLQLFDYGGEGGVLLVEVVELGSQLLVVLGWVVFELPDLVHKTSNFLLMLCVTDMQPGILLTQEGHFGLELLYQPL